MRRGTSFIAGPPTASPSPGLVTTPTPSPRSRCIPGSSHGETRAVRCAPSVTSGSSPASLTTTASAQAPPSPTSQRSTGKRTRRSSPLRGSFMSTSSCASPLTSALAAALAAAAAQVPVVQPVLSFSPLTLCMLGGMEGSRILRPGGMGCSLRLSLGLAERVGEGGAIEVRTCPARLEPRPHEDERLPGEARLAYPVGELVEAALYDLLIGPARPVDDRARWVRSVPTFQELLLQQARAGGGKEDRHGGTVGGEGFYILVVRHRGAAGAARQDHGLRDLRHRELDPDGGGGSSQRRDAGDYLPVE